MMATTRRTFETEFIVRYDECDYAGLLRPSVYLGYTQEAATRDSRDAGWGPHPWVIRRTRMYVHEPVSYAAKLTARTWGRGVARSSAQRAYEFYDEGRKVAEAHSLWVYLDRTTMRPARLPAEFNNIWFPAGTPAPTDLPDYAPLPESEPQRSSVQVGYSLLDNQQHVNNARYLDLMEDAAWAGLTAAGFGVEQLTALGGALLPTIYDIEHLNAAEAGDDLTIDTWQHSTTVNYLERQQQIHCGGKVIARSQSSWRWVNTLGEARALPTELAKAVGYTSAFG